MGKRVLSASSNSSHVRAYAHSKENGNVTVMLLNLHNETVSATIAFDRQGFNSSQMTRDEYHLTSSKLESSASPLLNNVRLQLQNGAPQLPFHGNQTSSNMPIHLAPNSYAFIVYPPAVNFYSSR